VRSYNENSKRRVVPRWRTSDRAVTAKELRPLRPLELPSGSGSALFSQLLEEFSEEPNLGIAAEIIATAVRLGKPADALVAAKYVNEHPGGVVPSALARSAAEVLANRSSINVPLNIADLRNRLRRYPRSAALWIDLSWHHASNGNIAKARRAMVTALALAPAHRWVLRSANRFLLHVGEAGEAHHLLISNPGTKVDPWLLSAELATAQIAGKKPKFIREARDTLLSRRHRAVHISELATALATIELEVGGTKFARRLLRQALSEPTENALAQIEWLDREINAGVSLASSLMRTPGAHEAACWVEYKEERIGPSLEAAMRWLNDEPFADRPPAMVCYLASFLDDYDLAINVASEALRRHPEEVLHRNNLAFAEICKGDILRAGREADLANMIAFLKREMSDISSDGVQAAANAGLLLYRSGLLSEGRKLYESAFQRAHANGNFIAWAVAATYHARECILANVEWAGAALDEARKAAKRTSSPGVNFYLRKVEAVAGAPNTANVVFSRLGSKRFEDSRRIIDGLRLIKTLQSPAGPILVIPDSLFRRPN
jgi:hypothetical protein